MRLTEPAKLPQSRMDSRKIRCPSRKHAAVLLAALASAAAAAFSLHGQSQPSPSRPAQAPMNLNLVVLDPAHGGSESGAAIADKVLEKDVTLAVAAKLRAALASAGFTVISTREGDNPDPINTDQRAEIANRTHALACIVIHATATGSGIHVYTSTLPPPMADADEAPSAFVPIPWDAAQSGFVRQSLSLASSLSSALGSNHLPASVGQAPLRPLDNMMCPAVAVEMAPLPAPGVGSTPASDANYQQQVATTFAAALRTWRDSLQPAAQAPPPGPATPQAKAIAAAQAVSHAAARTPAPNTPPTTPKGTP
jgi:N-acetylmuramoyl-L-alanine amidase